MTVSKSYNLVTHNYDFESSHCDCESQKTQLSQNDDFISHKYDFKIKKNLLWKIG